MKIKSLLTGLIFLLLVMSLALFLNLFVLERYFSFSLPFWNISLLFCIELSAVFLGLVWVAYSKFISKLFNLDFKEALGNDLFTYLPLVLLVFYLTGNLISASTLLGITLLLILILKAGMLLRFKGKFQKKYIYLVCSLAIITIVIMVHYHGVNYLITNYKPYRIPTLPVEQTLEEKLKNLYNADPLFLFTNDITGVYKKKIKIDEEIRNALVLLPPKRIETMVDVPPQSYLQFGFGVWEKSYKGNGDGVQFNLFFKDKDKDKIDKVYSKYIDPKHYEKDRKWFDMKLDLSGYAGHKISIIYEMLGSPEIQPPFERKANNIDDYAVISDPQIIQSKPERNTNSGYNIIFISLDTLRADHLGCYGYRRKDISPNIDKLAEEGVLFENTISHAPWTTPSHMSMFTSLLPSYHQVIEFGKDYLSEGKTTLARILKSNGYITAAYTGGAYMAGEWGFCLGFDNYYQKTINSFAADSGFGQIAEWLQSHRNQPFFLFLHTYKIHYPYTSLVYANEVMNESEIKELGNFFNSSPHNIANPDSCTAQLKKMNLFRREVTENLYDGGIRETDKYIGELLEKLKKLDTLNHTIIILTSDHGEEFGEHNPDNFVNGHRTSLYDEQIHVPLIWVAPANLLPKGKRIKSQVRLIDIMPTLLDLSKIKYEAAKMQGVSLLPIVRGDKINEELAAVSESTAYGDDWPENKSIRVNSYKYIYSVNLEHKNIYSVNQHESGNNKRILVSDHPDKEELYDLGDDPGEKNNLFREEANLSRKSKNRINNILEDAVKALPKTEKVNRKEVDEDTKSRLKALGYIQ